MHPLILEEGSCAGDLLPFTATRSVLDIRMGILTFREKWAALLGDGNFALGDQTDADAALDGHSGHGPALPANILPTRTLAARVREECTRGSLTRQSVDRLITHGRLIRLPWHIFQHNAEALSEDLDLLTAGRRSQPIPAHVQAICPEAIFIEEGARIGPCLLNASTGGIYIDARAEVMEGSLIRGPFAACEGATVKMGAKIYGATTIGPGATVGGELKNVVVFGYSNKGHDGYLGDSVIGEWCNLGAGTSASNLKNNAGQIRVWHPASREYLPAGIKCGLLMGDFSRSAINTSFNSGTVVGVCCNIFGQGIPPKYVPDFTWGEGRYEWEKALRDVGNWKQMKDRSLTEHEIARLKYIFEKL